MSFAARLFGNQSLGLRRWLRPWHVHHHDGGSKSQEQPRAFLAIDMANLAHMLDEVRRRGKDLDYRKLIDWLAEGRHLTNAKVYTGLDSNKQVINSFLGRLKTFGYEVVEVRGKTYQDGSTKRPNADTMIITDILSMIGSYDEATLVSGDGDFAYPVEILLRMGKQVRVVSTRHPLAQALRESGAEIVYLESKLPELLMSRVSKRTNSAGKSSKNTGLGQETDFGRLEVGDTGPRFAAEESVVRHGSG